jgi:selenocysteine lyase/cysteine desulfurase
VGVLLIVDAVHAAPHFPMDVQAFDPDFLLCSAYKFYGPHVGILYARPGLLDTLRPDHLRTADPAAPFRIETGTLNHAALAGVGAAIRYLAGLGEGPTLRAQIVDAMTGLAARERSLATTYFDAVRNLPGVNVWGPDFSSARRAPTVSITVDGKTAEEVARRLAERGILAWDGHFYAARAVEVLGLAGRGGLLRAGMALYTSKEDVDRLALAVAEIARS